MILINIPKAQECLAQYTRERRLALGFSQAGLSERAGVPLATLRKFEQKGIISLQSFLKLLMIVGGLDKLVESIKPQDPPFHSIEDVIRLANKKKPKRGRRK